VDQQISLTQCISHTLKIHTLCFAHSLRKILHLYFSCFLLEKRKTLFLFSSLSSLALKLWCVSSSLRRCLFIGQASCFMDNKVHQVVSQQPPSHITFPPSSSSFVNKWHHIFDLFGQRPIASKKRVGFPFFFLHLETHLSTNVSLHLEAHLSTNVSHNNANNLPLGELCTSN
jgi:hypothetical protein